MTGFHEELTSLAPEEFERHREALIAAKLQKDRSMQDAADRHWEQISNRRCGSHCHVIACVSPFVCYVLWMHWPCMPHGMGCWKFRNCRNRMQ